MPIDQIEEPSGIIVPIEEGVLRSIQNELAAIRKGQASQFDRLHERIANLEKAHGDSAFEYRVLRDAVDHARVVALRVESRLNNMEELEKQRKVRARQDTLDGLGADETPTGVEGRALPP